MNTAILELQRDLLFNQLMETENQLNEKGIKKGKQGFTLIADKKGIWYVRPIDPVSKKQLGKKCLYTTDRDEAIILAKKFLDTYIKMYYDRKHGINDIFKFFGEYYNLEKSAYLADLLKTGERKISKPIIQHYEGFINNYFLPFLTEKKIKRFNEINTQCLKDFQLYLLKMEKPLKPHTINSNIKGAIMVIYKSLLNKGVIKEIPFIANLPENNTKRRRGILTQYETFSVLFNKEMWRLYKTEDDIKNGVVANENLYKKYRLLCLLMATTGLRNSEIFMLKKENIVKIRRTSFLKVENSRIGEEGLKTESSKRKVPIPAITLQALNEYIAENKIIDYLFYSGRDTIYYNMFGFAKNLFGALCGYNEQELKDKNFDFYSFRHFYKTMLTHSNIKDAVVEYFMGHAINVSKMDENYTHIEDLDDEFFEENGLKVVEHIDNQLQNIINKLNLFPIHTHIEQVVLTDNNNRQKTYFAEVLNEMDFENETFLYLTDLSEKGILSPTNDKSQLLSELKILLENGKIDKRRYDDCVDYIQNDENQNFT